MTTRAHRARRPRWPRARRSARGPGPSHQRGRPRASADRGTRRRSRGCRDARRERGPAPRVGPTLPLPTHDRAASPAPRSTPGVRATGRSARRRSLGRGQTGKRRWSRRPAAMADHWGGRRRARPGPVRGRPRAQPVLCPSNASSRAVLRGPSWRRGCGAQLERSSCRRSPEGGQASRSAPSGRCRSVRPSGSGAATASDTRPTPGPRPRPGGRS